MRALLLISVVVMIAGIAAPKLVAEYVPRSSAVEARPPGPSLVEINADRDGHFYVDAEINSHRVRLIVDSGATVIALRRSDAEPAGIRPVPRDFTRPVSTANGTTYAAETELDRVAVGTVEVDGVHAFVLPDEQLPVSLLGAAFLNRLVRYEVQNGTLVLEN